MDFSDDPIGSGATNVKLETRGLGKACKRGRVGGGWLKVSGKMRGPDSRSLGLSTWGRE
jgi:hypothetical protein